MKLKDIFGAVVDRASQQSTYTGIAILAGLVGWNVDPAMAKYVAGVGITVAGAAKIILPDVQKAVGDVKAAVAAKPAADPAPAAQ